MNDGPFETTDPSAQPLDRPTWDGFLESLPIGLCRCDRDGVLMHYNRRAAELWGWSPAVAAAASNICPLIPDQPALSEALRTGQSLRHHQIRLERPDGSRRTLLANLDPLRGAGGALIGAVACFDDISALEHTEDGLRTRELWYRHVLEALPVAIYTTDAAGRITFYNEAATVLAGTRPELGSNKWCVTWRLFHPDGRPMPHEECPMALALKENRPVWGAEAIAERPDGVRVPFVPYPTPLRDEAGTLVGAVNLLVNISERKAAELERRRLVAELRRLNETLEERVEERSRALIAEIEERRLVEAQLHQLQKTEAIGQLTGGVAHDFNNLLTAVMGNLDCILAKSDAADIRKHAEAALRAARRGANLTHQLLAFSRRQQLELKASSINGLVTGMGEMLLPALGGTIRVQLRLSHALWPALIDANQIESAILNLAINARDAMPEGGTVTLETANVHIGPANRVAGLAPGDYVMIAVTDTGTGMSEAVKQRAFDPFFTTKDVGKGSGLGLSQVYGVARQSGGTAEIESTDGGGTTVRLYLPRAHAATRAPRREDDKGDDAAARRGEAVLVVDDDDDVRETIVACLRDLGYEVAAVASGGGAIAALEAGRFDLVIMDFAMPEMTGAEAGRLIAARWPRLPVLYITGYADPPALGSGIAEPLMLKKPFVSAELDARIRAILGRPARRAANVVPLHAQQI